MQVNEERIPLLEGAISDFLPLEIGLTHGRVIALLDANLEQHKALLYQRDMGFVESRKKSTCILVALLTTTLVTATLVLSIKMFADLGPTFFGAAGAVGIFCYIGTCCFSGPLGRDWCLPVVVRKFSDSEHAELMEKTRKVTSSLQPFSNTLADMRKVVPHFIALKLLGKQWKTVVTLATPTQLSDLLDTLSPQALRRLQTWTGDLLTDSQALTVRNSDTAFELLADCEEPTFFETMFHSPQGQEIAHRLMKRYWSKKRYDAVEWVLQNCEKINIEPFKTFLRKEIGSYYPWDLELLDLSIDKPKLYDLLASLYCERIHLSLFRDFCRHAERNALIRESCLQFYSEEGMRSRVALLWQKFEDFPLFLVTADLQSLVIQ